MTERLLTTQEVASRLSVSPDWVREHAAELGGIRIGDGPKGSLRFEWERVVEAMEARRLQPVSRRRRKRPGPSRRTSGNVELLPLPDRKLTPLR